MKQNTKTIFMAALGFDDQFDIICDLDNYMDDIDDENDAKYLEEIKK